MSKQLSAHQFKEVYQWLGVDLSKLGCLMLDTEPISIDHWIGQDSQTSYLTGFPLYYAENEKFWIKGYVGKEAHMTLLYGLMTEAKNYQPHIEKILADWKLDTVKIADIGYFDSPYEDEPYYCIVAHIEVNDALLEGHQRLEFLPHINTFTGYKPHITIAYIKKDENWRDSFIADLKKEFIGKELQIIGLNYGGNK